EVLPRLLVERSPRDARRRGVDRSAVARIDFDLSHRRRRRSGSRSTADLAHSMPCATGKILAQAPLRRFERKLVALRYERRSSIEHVRPAARGCSASTTMQELLELSNRGCSRSEVRWSKVSTVVSEILCGRSSQPQSEVARKSK